VVLGRASSTEGWIAKDVVARPHSANRDGSATLATVDEQRIADLIRVCQREAAAAIAEGNPPFGCVITDAQLRVVAHAHNTGLSDRDPTAHAEMNALRQLAKRLGTGRLEGHVSFANASSCSMCTSALIKAGITRFYYGAPPEPIMDPWLPMEEVAARSRHTIELHGPILGDECAAQIAGGRDRLRGAGS